MTRRSLLLLLSSLVLPFTPLACVSSRYDRCVNKYVDQANNCGADTKCAAVVAISAALDCGYDSTAATPLPPVTQPCVTCAQDACPQHSASCANAGDPSACPAFGTCIDTHCSATCQGDQ